MSLMLGQAGELILQDLDELCRVLETRALEFKGLPMIGRTHGQHAIPITFGLKMCVYLEEFMRHVQRLDELAPRVCVGKMLGAVGTGAGFGPKALEIQERVMKALVLGVETGATQVVARDRHVELLSFIANVACTCERTAQEVRNLQRTEINEVREGFDRKTQVGSSTMAQKMNPILSENICGLSRVARSFVTPMMESSILWHERDIANSSAERIIVPHACIVIDDVLNKVEKLLRNLEVYPKNMKRNLALTKGAIMSERILLELTRRGMGRQQAHELIRGIMVNLGEGTDLKKELVKKIGRTISPKDLDKLLKPETYIGASSELVDATLRRWEKVKDR
jgi:adenylosuccinate lyase